MEVLFETLRLSSDLSSHPNRQKRYGAEGAKKVTLRLQQMLAASTLQDLRHLPGRCRELREELAGYLTVDVHRPYGMLFRPTQKPPPVSRDGGLDWSRVESITITDIRDHH
jgi:toxin HigB-1